MAEDREILREVWDGRIPVCFRLAVDEVISIQPPDPFFLMIPRMSYFPLITENLQKQFSRNGSNVSESSNEMWLDYNGQPLRWHYPVGVLYDLYGHDAQLPWNLTVHFKNFPTEEILQCPNRSAVESHFMSTVKEADSLKHRGQIIGGMQKKDHSQLWLGLQNDKFDQFWSVNRKLMDKGSEDAFKHIPFRIYRAEKMWKQRLVRPVKANGESMVLEDLILNVIPEILQSSSNTHRIITHGIEVPLETPIQWLSEHLSYPDNFLHLCVIPRNT